VPLLTTHTPVWNPADCIRRSQDREDELGDSMPALAHRVFCSNGKRQEQTDHLLQQAQILLTVFRVPKGLGAVV
jgi:hypothetical protein